MRIRKYGLSKEWLQKLLPKYDYFCPKCKGQIQKNTHKCPHCGEKYPANFAVKAPPKILKDKEALSVYVHTKIFPSISQAHRDYLAQYFTTIFASDAEAGTFNDWSASGGSNAACTAEIVSDNCYNGAKAFHFVTNSSGGSGNDWAYATKSFTAQTTVFMRLYWKLHNLPANNDDRAVFAIFSGNGTWELKARYEMTGGTKRFYLDWGDGLGGAAYNTDISADVWYCIELAFNKNTSGYAKMWLDGTLIIDSGTVDLSARNSIDVIGVMQNKYYGNNWQCEAWIDCVAVADTAIGAVPFEDGFESGDLSHWTATHTYNSSIYDTSTVKESGTYSLHLQYDYDYCYKKVPASDTLNFRFYVMWDTNPASGETINIADIQRSGDMVARAGITNDSGTIKWKLTYVDSSLTTQTATASTPNPTTNRWYCVEISATKNGTGYLYVDGATLITTSTLEQYWQLTNCWLSKLSESGSTNPHIYFDSVKISTVYIGPHKIFHDGFESGDFSNWTTTSGTPTVQNTTKYSGLCAACAESGDKYFQKNLASSYSTLHTRFYVYLSSLTLSENNFLACLWQYADISNGTWQSFCGVNGTTGKLCYGYKLGETTYSVDSSITAETNRWYCLELITTVGINGSVNLYIDGVSVGATSVNNSVAGNINCIVAGTHWSSVSATAYFDDVIVADQYIGPLPFQDGFESGDFSHWTTASGSVQLSTKKTGTYAAYMNSTWQAATKTFTATTEAYLRAYVNISSLSGTSGSSELIAITNTSNVSLVRAVVTYSDGNYVLRLRDDWGTYYDTGITVTLNTWYCIEIGYRFASDGFFKLWVDNTLAASHTANTTGHNSLSNIFAVIGCYGEGSLTIARYFDDVVVSDCYIGIIASTGATISDSGSGVDSVLISAAISPFDVGYGSDGLSVTVQINLSDFGSGSEITGHTETGGQQTLTLYDSGVGGEVISVSVTVTLGDSAQASETLSLAALIQAQDNAAATDNASVQAALTLIDSGAGSDNLALQALISALETGTAQDRYVAGTIRRYLEFTEKRRQAATTETQKQAATKQLIKQSEIVEATL